MSRVAVSQCADMDGLIVRLIWTMKCVGL